MNNACEFSPCRLYRYTLEHVIAEAQADPIIAGRRIQWIGLNPSTADENQLDPTLRRIRAFTIAAGFGGFIMTNVFAFRATDPKDMRAQADPIGPGNDEALIRIGRRCGIAVACWGSLAKFPKSERHRPASIRIRFREAGVPLLHLELNSDGTPKHPLYVDGATQLKPYA